MGLLDFLFNSFTNNNTSSNLSDSSDLSLFNQTLRNAKTLKTDLLEMSEHECTCEICSIYQGRVFSISGKDTRFPKLPEIILQTGTLHEGCRHEFFPFVYGCSSSAYGHRDIIKYSNRPFKDYRTKKEKQQYEKMLQDEQEYDFDKENYELLKIKLPDICPKSFSGYRKMKHSNSNNFAKLKLEADKIGIYLDITK